MKTTPRFSSYRTTLNILTIAISILISGSAIAAKPIYSGGKERAAIRGYDPVAYFTENEPVKGSAEFVFEHKGAKWMFSSAQNLELFKSNPEKYSPQFGGYCAYAVSRNTTASIKPEYFTIHNDKLYLNYSKSVNKRWLKDKEKYIDQAESNWPNVLDD
ncbi:MAG: YHS domain-containing protein [Acidiferrobacterales bacterium]|nr:YHS domain-containing protein [Acidiferrobacterales bacterium]